MIGTRHRALVLALAAGGLLAACSGSTDPVRSTDPVGSTDPVTRSSPARSRSVASSTPRSTTASGRRGALPTKADLEAAVATRRDVPSYYEQVVGSDGAADRSAAEFRQLFGGLQAAVASCVGIKGIDVSATSTTSATSVFVSRYGGQVVTSVVARVKDAAPLLELRRRLASLDPLTCVGEQHPITGGDVTIKIDHVDGKSGRPASTAPAAVAGSLDMALQVTAGGKPTSSDYEVTDVATAGHTVGLIGGFTSSPSASIDTSLMATLTDLVAQRIAGSG